MDLVLRRGTVIDGVSGNLYKADVGIVDDYITRVGDLSGLPARREIDANGLVVAPGFLDAGGRSDLTLLAEPTQFSKISQGVTTETVGLAGFSPFPNLGANAARVAREADRLGIDPAWRDAAGYLKRVRDTDPAVNVAVFAGHGALRSATLGLSRRPASDLDLARMGERLREDLACGLFGLSLDLRGAPGSSADEAELRALCGLLDPTRHHLNAFPRDTGAGLPAALEELLRAARPAGIPLHLPHFPLAQPAAEEFVRRIEAARARRIDLTAEIHAYAEVSFSLATLLPDWVLADGAEATLRRLRDPLVRARVRTGLRRRVPDADGFGLLRVTRVADPRDAWTIGLDLAELHRRTAAGRDPAETALDLIARNGLDVEALLTPGDGKGREALLARPFTLAATGEPARGQSGPTTAGSPHPGAFGAFPRLLRRAHDEGGMRALAHMVRRITSLPAERLRLPDRGRVAPGFRADLVLLDPPRLRDAATFEKPCQASAGVRAVIVNGRIGYREGEGVIARAGRVLRPGPAA